MHDDVIRSDRLDVFEHLLEALAVGGAGRLPGVHILMLRLDDSAKLRGLGVTGGALRGDGVAFGPAARAGLLLGADPEVGEGDGSTAAGSHSFTGQNRAAQATSRGFERRLPWSGVVLLCHSSASFSIWASC
jgi:hypothetical protein